MIRKSLIVVMALFFLAGMLTATTSADEDYGDLAKKVEALSKDVDKLESMVKDFSFQLQQAQSTSSIIKELSFELKKLESSVRDLEGVGEQVEGNRSRIVSLEGTIQGVAASTGEKIKVLQGRVFDLETTVDALDARLQSVEGKVRELLDLKKQVMKLQDQVDRLQGRMDKLAEMPAGPEATAKLIDRIEGLRMQLSAQISDLSDRISALEKTVSSLPIEELQSRIDRNSSRISALEAGTVTPEDVDVLRARIAQLEQQLKGEVEGVKSQTNTNMVIATLGLLAGLAALATAFGLF